MAELPSEDMIVSVENKRIPEGMCLVVWHGKVYYAGPIEKSRVKPGCKIHLNPLDFDSINAWYKKMLN